MDEKKIGDLWEELRISPPDTFAFQDEMMELIRKLVEVEAWALKMEQAAEPFAQPQRDDAEWIKIALDRFGIPPETWK